MDVADWHVKSIKFCFVFAIPISKTAAVAFVTCVDTIAVQFGIDKIELG